jgi:hypothetical protein
MAITKSDVDGNPEPVCSPLDHRFGGGEGVVGEGDQPPGPDHIFSAGSVQATGRRVLSMLQEAERLTVAALDHLGVVDDACLAQLWGYTSTERMVAHGARRSGRDGRDLVAVARHLRRHPATRQAVAAGEVSLAQAMALAAAARGFDEVYAEAEARLLAACSDRDVEQLRQLLHTWRSHHDDDKATTDAEHRWNQRGVFLQPGFDGSCTGTFRLDPVGAEAFTAALETRPDPTTSLSEPRTPAQRRHDKLIDLCHEHLHGGPHCECDCDGGCADDRGGGPGSDHSHQPAGSGRNEGQVPVHTATPTDQAAPRHHSRPPDPDPSTERSTGPTDSNDRPEGPAPDGRARTRTDLSLPPPSASPGGPTHPAPVPGPWRPRPARGGAPVAFNVVIDIETLGGNAPHDLDRLRCELGRGVPIGGPTLDRLLCDASFRALITDGPRSVLATNRATPDIPPALRRTVHLRDRHCQFTGCVTPGHWCDIHHIIPRNRGGPTNHENLVLLCRFHHGLVHDGGWTLARAPNGTITVTSP